MVNWHQEAIRRRHDESLSAIARSLGKNRSTVHKAIVRNDPTPRPLRLVSKTKNKQIVEVYFLFPDFGVSGLATYTGFDEEDVKAALRAAGLNARGM